jgi:endonuclease/exonuclease/phosphatase family metal-dependent hydrolase
VTYSSSEPSVATALAAIQPDSSGHAQPSAAPTRRPRWRRWGLRLVVTLNLAWLTLVVLHSILSDRVYWWGPVDLLPPLAFAVVPILLLVLAFLARPLRWRLVATAVLALMLGFGYSGVNLATLWHRPPPVTADAVTVVTWNTEYWDQDMRNNGATTEGLYAFLRGLDADVYLLHEYAHVDTTRVDVFSQALAIDQQDLLAETFPEYTIVIAGRNIVLSRLPVVGHRWLNGARLLPEEFRSVPPGLADRPLFYRSQTLRVDIEVAGRPVSFYNAHFFQPPVRLILLRSDPDRSMFEIDRFNFEMRHAAFAAVAEDMATNPNPVVLGGDLNTSPAMNILRRLPDHLVDHTPALSSLYPATWRIGTLSQLWRIDWLFTSPDVAVHEYQLLDPSLYSDHQVQRAVISVEGGQPVD